MGVRFFLKRLAIYLAVFTVPIVLICPLLLGGYSLRNIAASLFFEGALLIIFGGCLSTSIIEGYATARYSTNPAVTRDTREHLSERRSEQTLSGVVFFAAGVFVLAIALVLFSLPVFALP
jgi:hypothetical protein